MRVKIGDDWYDSEIQWLGVQFTEEEIECIKQLNPETSHLSFVAGNGDGDDLVEWLSEGR